MLPLHAAMYGVEFGAGLFQSGTGREASEEFGHAVDSSGDHRRGKMMRAGDDVADDLSLLRIRNTWFQNADDSGIARIDEGAEPNGLPDNGRIAVQGC